MNTHDITCNKIMCLVSTCVFFKIQVKCYIEFKEGTSLKSTEETVLNVL